MADKQNEAIELIVSRLMDAKKAYYLSDTPLISDAEFDSLEEKLRAEDPQNPYFSRVGVSDGTDKIVHPVPMLSMGKGKSTGDIGKWLERLVLPEGTLFCLQPKIDGLSASCRYRNGKILYAATRGDGVQGQDVSHIISYMKDIPETISFSSDDIEIRGELYLPKNTSFNTGGRPLRNNCVGLINRKEDRDDLRFVRFVAYQITPGENVPLSEYEKIDCLKKEGFHTVEALRLSTLEEIEVANRSYLEKDRDKWLYETDGLIITVDDSSLFEEIDSRWVVDHHHHYAIAFKPPSASLKTCLKGIEWQVSRQGAVVPVALFEPIVLGGATLERASLHNEENVRSMALAPGDQIEVERANDVIPYVRANHSAEGRNPDSFIHTLIPFRCPSCHNLLVKDGVHLKCTSGHCQEQTIQQILFWVRQSGMEQIAEGTIRQLYKEGIVHSIKDLYTLKRESLVSLDGFADKKIDNLLHQAEKGRSSGAVELISRLGIPLVQKKALKKLGISTIRDFFLFQDDSYVIGRNIIEWKGQPSNRRFLMELLQVLTVPGVKVYPMSRYIFPGTLAFYHQLVFTEEKERASVNKGKGSVCLTGKAPLSRKEMSSLLEADGYEVSSAVSSKTGLLLCDNPDGQSSKLKKARSNGIPVLSYNDYLAGKKGIPG